MNPSRRVAVLGGARIPFCKNNTAYFDVGNLGMMAEFGNAIRWSDWDAAWSFIDPATRKSLVLPGEEQDRLHDIKVTGYQVRTSEPQPDGTIMPSR